MSYFFYFFYSITPRIVLVHVTPQMSIVHVTPRIVLGTMTFSGQTAKADALTMLSTFATHPLATPGSTLAQIDSARMYGGGKTEELIGEMLTENAALRATLAVASKAHPFMGSVLDTAGVTNQATESIAALQAESIDLFYLHGPCAKTPIEETLAAVQALYESDKFARFGLSNFTAWETVWIHSFMEKKGWVVPQVYQGMLNVTTRAVVDELFPALRRLGMAFNAYNPLAGGMLTGKYDRAQMSSLDSGRFTGAQIWGRIYQDRFMQPLHFDAVDLLRVACDAESIPMHEMSLRWMMHHSPLSGSQGDAIIIGASKTVHFDSNLAALSKGPLPPAVVAACDEAWLLAKPVCPSFSRGYAGSELAAVK